MALWGLFAVVMTAVVVFSIGTVGYMRRENRLYSAEQKLWDSLAQDGQPAEGVLRGLRMHPSNMTRGGSRVQSAPGEMDASLETRWKSVTAALHRDVDAQDV